MCLRAVKHKHDIFEVLHSLMSFNQPSTRPGIPYVCLQAETSET